jgi:trimethylamine--corrinoid protein Co-methyltransferase
MLWATNLAATDVVLHAAGWLEGGLTASFEKFALEVELLRQFQVQAKAIGFTEEEIASYALKGAGPGGLFLSSPHTRAHFKDWLDMSPLFSTPDFATWETMGSETTEIAANRAWKQLLDSYEDPGLDPASMRSSARTWRAVVTLPICTLRTDPPPGYGNTAERLFRKPRAGCG